jgi:heat shock protein HtpX
MEHAFGLYTHIRSNRRRSTALLIGLFFLVYVLTYAGALVGEAVSHGGAAFEYLVRAAFRDFLIAWPFVTAGTALWVWIAYKFHQSIIDMLTGGTEVTRKEQPRLYNLLENLCISRGMPVPRLKIAETSVLNAFTTGMNDKQYAITVTRGLVDNLNDRELEAVLAHELTHIRNGDVRMLVIAVIIAGVISFFGEMIFRIFFQSGMSWGGGRRSDSDKKGGGAALAIVIALALVAVAWILSIVIHFALSRTREYLADAGAVELTKNPDGMIMALRKIEGRGELEGATSAVMEMCVDNPREGGFGDLFDTHPPIEKRVAALIKYAGGGVDPGPIALAPPAAEASPEPPADAPAEAAPQPWGTPLPLPGMPGVSPVGAAGQPFLPPRSPLAEGGGDPGPWGPHRG